MLPLDDVSLAVSQARRKAHIREREFWLAEQKSCGRNDRELARYASDQAKEHLQLEKAATWVISFTQGTVPSYAPGGSHPGSWTVQQMPGEMRDKIMHEHACADYGIPVLISKEKES
jgi:hypothetical protein